MSATVNVVCHIFPEMLVHAALKICEHVTICYPFLFVQKSELVGPQLRAWSAWHRALRFMDEASSGDKWQGFNIAKSRSLAPFHWQLLGVSSDLATAARGPPIETMRWIATGNARRPVDSFVSWTKDALAVAKCLVHGDADGCTCSRNLLVSRWIWVVCISFWFYGSGHVISRPLSSSGFSWCIFGKIGKDLVRGAYKLS